MKIQKFLIILILLPLVKLRFNHTCQQHMIDDSHYVPSDPQPNQGRRFLQEQEWEPFRVTFDYSALQNLTGDLAKYKDFMVNQGELAVKFFAENLQVKRLTQNNKFPSTQSKCYKHTVNQTDKDQGIPDSDMHIYFTHANDTKEGYFAWAASCVYNWENNRPRFAQVNWNSFFMQFYDLDKNDVHEFFLEVTLHEITHALGFTSWLYNRWIDPATGRPYLSSNKQPTQTVKVGNEEFTYITTPKVREFAREHFNCSTAKGMRLENNGGGGSKGSHWEKTQAENEFMTAQVLGHDAIYSKFTFALFEDSGWYLPTYQYVDHADWGKNKGCDFLESCDPTRFREFVNDTQHDFCNFYHNGVATREHDNNFAAGCEMPQLTYRLCIDDSRTGSFDRFSGEYFGQNSRCFKSDLRPSYIPENDMLEYVGEARCLKYECDEIGDISVYANGEKHIIDRETNQVEIKASEPNQVQGIIHGPEDWFSFCYTYPKPCKNFCSAHGYCLARTCHCLKDWAGEDCSISCENDNYIQDGQCLNTQQCPQGYQVNAETKECLKINDPCNGQINFNGQCLANCPSRTYQENNTCKSCVENCLQCNNGNSCNTCEQNHFLFENSCLPKCPQGYVGTQQQICEACPFGCAQCNQQKQCQKCLYNGLLFFNESLQQTQCVNKCPSGYYKQGQSCMQCQQGCTQCSSKNQCQSCQQGYYIFDDRQLQSQTCVRTCPIGATFSIPTKKCIRCTASQIFFNNRCINQCPKGYFQEDNTCQQCDEVCETCSSADTCDTCAQGFIYNPQNQFCEVGEIQCPQGCEQCSQTDSCDVCNHNKVKYTQQNSSVCLDSCPDGYENKNRVCEKKEEKKGSGSKLCGPDKYEYRTWRGFTYCLLGCPSSMYANELGQCMRK